MRKNTESGVEVVRKDGGRGGETELEVTLTSQTSEDRLQLVCKVFRHQHISLGLDINWQLPALDTGHSQLHKDDIMMMMNSRYSLEEVELDSIIVSTLVIQEVDEDDQGVYKCIVETIDGKSFEAETFVNVEDVPSELITIPPAFTGQRERNLSNSGTTPRLLSVFTFIYGVLFYLNQ